MELDSLITNLLYVLGMTDNVVHCGTRDKSFCDYSHNVTSAQLKIKYIVKSYIKYRINIYAEGIHTKVRAVICYCNFKNHHRLYCLLWGNCTDEKLLHQHIVLPSLLIIQPCGV
jgi:hypothetical protein